MSAKLGAHRRPWGGFHPCSPCGSLKLPMYITVRMMYCYSIVTVSCSFFSNSWFSPTFATPGCDHLCSSSSIPVVADVGNLSSFRLDIVLRPTSYILHIALPWNSTDSSKYLFLLLLDYFRLEYLLVSSDHSHSATTNRLDLCYTRPLCPLLHFRHSHCTNRPHV